MKLTIRALIAIPACVMTLSASAVENRYDVTDAEQAACQADVVSLCSDAGQDQDKILACMKANRASLAPHCRLVFDEGLRRRGMR